jgi:UDP-glucose 4-epimerase
VSDLADAHVRALGRLRDGGASAVYNLGNGRGFSVREVIEAARAVTGRTIPAAMQGRRPGDPAVLVAAAGKAQSELGWTPQHASLESIIASAWRWHESHPRGYRG